MNPFKENALNVEQTFMSFGEMSPKAYNKMEVDPYTKARVILANGAEYEAVWFSHQFSRHCADNDIRRDLSLIRRSEQQQQKRISALSPINESLLETTISYEQLAVDLTAFFAQRESDRYVKEAYDFALIEDFDHLYRYADLLEMDSGIEAERLVGKYTEIMPGRPTISEHRYPIDDIKRYTNFNKASAVTKLDIAIITAAEQQTMNYYMNQCASYGNNLGRQLYREIGLIEEQHVSMYGSLLDTTQSWYEGLLSHEYAECYLYYSLMLDETDKYIKKIWEEHFNIELSHLKLAETLLKKYAQKEWQQVIGVGDFPEPIKLQSNIDYVREVLKSVELTGDKEDYTPVTELKTGAPFFAYQRVVNDNLKNTASHCVIAKYISDNDTDYRFEVKRHPVDALCDRTKDNTWLGRE
ncbi:MAG: hypothetical protein RR086_00405 [Clostridia bacterium]